MRFKKLSFIALIPFIIRIPLTFILIVNFGIAGALLGQIIFFLIYFVLLLGFSKEKSFNFDRKLAFDVFKYSLVIGIAGLAYFLYTNIDIVFLEQYGYLVEIGNYKIVNRFLELTYTPFIILGQVIAPSITILFTKKQFDKLKKLTYNMSYIFILGIVISILSYLLFPILIQLFFSEYYNTNILLIGNLLLLLIPFKCIGVILIHGFLIPAGLGKITMNLTILGGITNVILDYLFIELFGFLGIFYTTLIVHLTVICLTFIIYYRKVFVKDKSSTYST
jgi:O-antigen/teichoic acid export membrane protein